MSQAVKVGIFMAIGLVALAVLILKVEDIRLFGPRGQRIAAQFDSVAGLDAQAPVRVAGVRIGQVEEIQLEGRAARVTLLLEEPIDLRRGAAARIATVSLLGDKYIELDPGDPTSPPLPEGTVLQGTTPVSFDDALAKLNELAGSLAGEPGAEGGVPALMGSLRQTSDTIRLLVEANQRQVDATVANFQQFSATLARELPHLAGQIEQVLTRVDGILAENREVLAGSLENIERVTGSMQASVDNLNTITGGLARGEGTLGKLLTSDEAHTELVSTLDSIQGGVNSLGETFGRINRIKLDLAMDSYYLEDPEEYRNGFSIDVRPSEERFYRIGLVDDPRGRTKRRTEVVTVIQPDGSSETTTTEFVTTRDELTFNAQFGFDFGPASLRAGLFESTGGGGIDYGLIDDRLRLSLDLFDFNRQDDLEELDPRLRLTGRWSLNPHLYLLGGVDDLLVSDRQSFFLGGGVTWNDDDLKYLMGSIPRF
ncbi:MAG: MlaD family protein [Thermoanaerobaculia bacterium]